MSDEHTYRMTISLNVLKHLGVGLYSNVPAVLSEAVANAWDADAARVRICIERDTITIEDDGHGMSVGDANDRYLRVGYQRRKESGGLTPILERPVMGRKGIGKLSLFSVAKTVSVYSVKDGQAHGFKMDTDLIEEGIRNKKPDYYPERLDVEGIAPKQGTKIVLSDLKRRTHQSSNLRKRLARRFSIIGDKNGFEVLLNGEPITVKDRAYHEKLQYVWTFGSIGREAAANVPGIKQYARPPEVQVDGRAERIDGWIGTVQKAGQTKDADTGESLNAISIMVRGKMAQEDILEEFGEGGLYSSYVIGEIHADFLDMDDKDDTATTGRQRLIEDDPRYQALRDKIKCELKTIQNQWTAQRNKDGPNVALAFPGIQEWYDTLDAGHKTTAQRLFGRINQYTVDDDVTKRRLFVGAILAFEVLKFRNLLDLLKDIKVDNLDTLGDVFRQLDEIEANAYYQITKDRFEVINKLGELVDDNAKERVIQEHLFDHLWLLDPSWERATHTEHMESSIRKAFEAVDKDLTDEQKKSRLDIKYTTTGNKHVIIELKRPERALDSMDILAQIKKYRGAVTKALKAANKSGEPLEFVCVLGREPTDWKSYQESEQESRDALEQFHARIVMYDELIENAERAYKDYTEQRRNVTQLYRLIQKIAPDDVAEMSRPGDSMQRP